MLSFNRLIDTFSERLVNISAHLAMNTLASLAAISYFYSLYISKLALLTSDS